MHRKRTILHVDDNDANRYAVSRWLVKAGFEVVEAQNGTQALNLVQANPDLVILDIRLPDMNGYEVCRQIKKDPRTARIPVLHLSASAASSADKVRGLDGGAEGYLIRPVDPAELVAIVNVLLRNREAEEALRESEERFRLMANSIPQLSWMARPDGTVFWYNDRWYDYTGTNFEQMERTGWQSLVDPAELPRVRLSFQQALASGEPWEDTFPLRSGSGQLRWHLSRARPLRDLQGNVTLWFGTNTDVSDQREAEQLLRQSKLDADAARAAAEEANRLKDDFLATLSHELRTPLNAILGWARLLHMSGPNGSEFNEGINAIERNANVQSQLIEDLLDVTRIISGKLQLERQRVEMARVIQDAMEAVSPLAASKGVRLKFDSGAGVPVTCGDPARLQQIVWNLLSNAIKFSESGGSVRIHLAAFDSQIQIRVQDNGRGIKRDFLPHVFERFRQADSTTKRRQGGLGLGLAIVRQLVESHGGTIAADSEGEGKGATFTVTIPIQTAPDEKPADHQAVEAAANQVASGEERPSLAGTTILVVENEPDAREILRLFLEERGAEVVPAGSVGEAMEKLAETRFDLVISDIGMPDQDGFDLIRQLRALPLEKGGRTPTIALTAFARQEERARLLAAGFQAHLPKPVDPTALINLAASLSSRSFAGSHSARQVVEEKSR